jgi:hypothetical protein
MNLMISNTAQLQLTTDYFFFVTFCRIIRGNW